MKLFLTKLPYSLTPDDLRELCRPYGRVTSVAIPIDRETGQPRGFAFVGFDDEDAVFKAVAALNNFEIDGRTIRVEPARRWQ